MGVATAIFGAIERDALELMQLMRSHFEVVNYNGDEEFVVSGIDQILGDGRIDLLQDSVDTREALGFYRSMGFQCMPWPDQAANKPRSRLTKFVRRLSWGWFFFRNPYKTNLVKRLHLERDSTVHSKDELTF